MALKIVFWGTPDYAVPSLQAIHAAGHEVLAVVTQPDRPAGRSMQLQPTPVKAAALALGLPAEKVLQPESTRDPALYAALQNIPADVYCVVAYGGLLIRRLLKLPRLLTLNAHGSLLPKYRGAAPVQAAILNGDTETGVSLMKMVRELDAGPEALRRVTAIGSTETCGELMDRLARLSGEIFVEGLACAESGTLMFTPQDAARASYTKKIDRADAVFAWTEPAAQIARKVRAFSPWPGVKVQFVADDAAGGAAGEQKPLKPWTLTLLETAVEPATPALRPPVAGEVVAADPKQGLVVVCGDGRFLRLIKIKPEGKPAMLAVEWLRGVRGRLRVAAVV